MTGNWAPRIGAVYDLLGNGRSKLFGNYGRFFARVPNDLAARVLSADEAITRGDYFDAGLTRPVPDGTLASGWVNNLDLGRTFGFSKAIEERLRTLTAADVNAALRRRIDPAKFTVILAGDAKKGVK